MKHATTRELYDYWNRVRGGERAPLRSAIEPSDIRRILGEMFILEVAGRENYFVRLAGTRVCALYCREIKGTNFLDLWSGEDRHAMATLAAAVSEDGAAAVVTIAAETERKQEVLCEAILLPLRHGNGARFDRMLGSCAVTDRPYWLGSEPVVRQRVASLRLIWPDEVPVFMRRRSDRIEESMAPVPAVPLPIAGSRRHGHLFVVDGGKS